MRLSAPLRLDEPRGYVTAKLEPLTHLTARRILLTTCP
jgi:hypothetical protein